MTQVIRIGYLIFAMNITPGQKKELQHCTTYNQPKRMKVDFQGRFETCKLNMLEKQIETEFVKWTKKSKRNREFNVFWKNKLRHWNRRFNYKLMAKLESSFKKRRYLR